MKLTRQQAKEIRALKRMKDEDIDFSDIPEMRGDEKLIIGKFYRPIKKSLTIRIDADVLAWVKGQGKGYQTRINGILREAMKTSAKAPVETPPRRRAQRTTGLVGRLKAANRS